MQIGSFASNVPQDAPGSKGKNHMCRLADQPSHVSGSPDYRSEPRVSAKHGTIVSIKTIPCEKATNMPHSNAKASAKTMLEIKPVNQ